MVHEIFVDGTEIQGVGFVNNQHLAVAPDGAGIYVYTLDPNEMIDLVRDSLPPGLPNQSAIDSASRTTARPAKRCKVKVTTKKTLS